MDWCTTARTPRFRGGLWEELRAGGYGPKPPSLMVCGAVVLVIGRDGGRRRFQLGLDRFELAKVVREFILSETLQELSPRGPIEFHDSVDKLSL